MNKNIAPSFGQKRPLPCLLLPSRNFSQVCQVCLQKKNAIQDRRHNSSSSASPLSGGWIDADEFPKTSSPEGGGGGFDPASLAAPVLSKTPLILLERVDSTLFRAILSSEPETLARCFLRGLPTNISFNDSLSALFSDAPTGAANALGGVVAILEGATTGVLPEAGLAVESPLFGIRESEECWRLS